MRRFSVLDGRVSQWSAHRYMPRYPVAPIDIGYGVYKR